MNLYIIKTKNIRFIGHKYTKNNKQKVVRTTEEDMFCMSEKEFEELSMDMSRMINNDLLAELGPTFDR